MNRKLVWLIAFVLTLILGGVTACGTPVTGLSEDDETAIYTAIVRQLYQSSQPANFPITFLAWTTDDNVGVPSAPKSSSRRLGPKIQRDIPYRLTELPTELVWIENTDAVKLDSSGKVENGGAIITFGNAHLQEDGSVLVSARLYATPDVITNKTFLFEQLNGVWQIVGEKS